MPPPLAAIFENQLTVSTSELSRLLPMSSRILEAHVRHGHIDFVDFSTSEGRPRRAFTLAQVRRFIASPHFLEAPYPLRPDRRALVAVETIWEGPSLSERVAQHKAEREAKRLAQQAEWDAMRAATAARKEAERSARAEARAEKKREREANRNKGKG